MEHSCPPFSFFSLFYHPLWILWSVRNHAAVQHASMGIHYECLDSAQAGTFCAVPYRPWVYEEKRERFLCGRYGKMSSNLQPRQIAFPSSEKGTCDRQLALRSVLVDITILISGNQRNLDVFEMMFSNRSTLRLLSRLLPVPSLSGFQIHTAAPITPMSVSPHEISRWRRRIRRLRYIRPRRLTTVSATSYHSIVSYQVEVAKARRYSVAAKLDSLCNCRHQRSTIMKICRSKTVIDDDDSA